MVLDAGGISGICQTVLPQEMREGIQEAGGNVFILGQGFFTSPVVPRFRLPNITQIPE
jgi:hypothetical protein